MASKSRKNHYFKNRANSKEKEQLPEDREIYIMLSQTRTYFARLIKLYTKEPYAHASIAFDEDLEEMYSFARLRPKNPFITGFVEEDINSGVFGACTETTCCVYSLKVTQEQYDRLKSEVEVFKRNRDKYSYNFLGIVGVMIHKPINSKNRYFCSQFVAHILEKSGIKLFNKSSALVRPFDIRICPKLKKIYQGKLVDYRDYRNLILNNQGVLS
ncbi:hypothetical protein EDD66_10825 [Mobilisporobacter senegalensis]|uniref:Permuted papain-like amidase YaeF/Yiix C92 family enzyme n=1 Tax=Mobilisporobacter senegalensis TaxID=1329262 RepID=A0A3N1XHX6_9FIRM|nr:hypothetical protein [Mobilisporobacter senegalensis]ROR26303.1 hypothetical protein EDD66_10825 [Mobilisporobacter senegalensis]